MAEMQKAEVSRPPIPDLSQGRENLREHLLEQGHSAEKVDLFLKTIDKIEAKSDIYSKAANKDYTAGLEALKIADKVLEEKIAERIKKQTDQLVLPPKKISPSTSPTSEKPLTLAKEDGPSCTIKFQTNNRYGYLDTTSRDLRLDSSGNLQMRFIGTDGNSVWMEPKDHTTGINVTCLYIDNGKVLDASGKQVTHLNWGGNHVDVGHALRYTDKIEEGKVSGIKDGYLKDLKLEGSQVVFTKGKPPSAIAAEEAKTPEPSIKPSLNPEQERLVAYKELLLEAKRSIPHALDQREAWDKFINNRLKMLEELASKSSLEPADLAKLKEKMDLDFSKGNKDGTSIADFVEWAKKTKSAEMQVTQTKSGKIRIELPDNTFDNSWRAEVSGIDVGRITVSRTENSRVYEFDANSEVKFSAVQYGYYRDRCGRCHQCVMNSKSVTINPSESSESQIQGSIDKLMGLLGKEKSTSSK